MSAPTVPPRLPGDTPTYRMGYVLHHWPRPIIERATFRALLPAGESYRVNDDRYARSLASNGPATFTVNRVSRTFLNQLRSWEKRHGAIRRIADRVQILDRDFFAPLAELLTLDTAAWLAETVQQHRLAPLPDDTRRREFLAIQALMETRGQHHDSGRGAVRLLPRGGTL